MVSYLGLKRRESLKKKGYTVSERLISIDELAEAMENGTLEEACGCGTAAVVSPIGELCYKDMKFAVNNGEIGEVTQYLYDTHLLPCASRYALTYTLSHRPQESPNLVF